MNILSSFLSVYKNKDQVELPKRELLLFAVAALREAQRIEYDNTGTPGKAAIEYLLNMKYQIVENRRINDHAKDLILAELDGVISKVAAKYRVKRKGKQFIFDESLGSEDCTIIGLDGSDVYADLYKAQTELGVLRIQLARTDLNSSGCLRLRQAIMSKEEEIKEMKLSLIKYKFFSQTPGYDPMYRRSLGEDAKDSAKTGAIAGGVTGALIGKHSAIKSTGHGKALKQAKTAINFLKNNRSKGEEELKKYAQAKNASITNKKTLERAGQSRGEASQAAQKAKDALKKLSREKSLGNKYKAQAMNKLTKTGQKVLQKSVKSGVKGALAGAAAGLALYGAKKLADKKHEQLIEQLEKRIEQTRRK